MNSVYGQLVEHMRETALLVSIESLLNWDERTMLPTAAGEYRAEQITYMAGTMHRHRTDPRVGEWLNILADEKLDPHSDE
ncbi:MAG TPA: carboxypeptidase M32, partial [Pirellulales bacterium]